MSRSKRRAAKVDANQVEMVKVLRTIPGLKVESDHDDILVGFQGKNYWFEIKNPDSISKKTNKILDSRKKDHQIELEKNWTGQYDIVTSLGEILEIIGIVC